MQCFELLGASGNFASNINSCFGVLHACETHEIRRLILQRGYTIHIWTDRTRRNSQIIENIAKETNSRIVSMKNGLLILFKRPIIVWIVCTANILTQN